MQLFEETAALLESGESLASAVILERSGSAPRSVGSRMLVRVDGTILGSVGGGLLEARVMELATEVLQDRGSRVREFTLTPEDACRSGMICGGHVRVLVQFVDASDTDQVRLYRELAAMLRAHHAGWLVTRLPEEGDAVETCRLGLFGKDESTWGTLDAGLIRGIVSRFGSRSPGMIRAAEGSFFVEPLRRQSRVLIFGAGHVSQQLAPLTGLAGFRTIVLDDREEFATRERFPTAESIHVLPAFEGALEGLPIDEDSYLVLVTRGHAHDETVLRQALRTRAGYIGMIGSRHKRDAIYRSLLEDGFTPGDLDRVHSPIGLKIGAETPVEIAVSIVAELIQVRAGKTA